ncbi:MAG: methyltransferase domain-containing protein [Planctomycetes bacterium]|nr:methyltransferase domain-containing protein [Planctomycetota bacterium]
MLERAIGWIKDNTIPGKGIVITSKREVCYPEVTGYYIPTLLSLGEDKLAHQYARWLVSVQQADGSFGLDGKGYAFDTGQVVRGFVALVEQMPELESPLRRACNWLIEIADAQTGRLQVPSAGGVWKLGSRGEVNEGINLYVLKPLRQAGELLNEPGYIQFVDKSLNYYLENVTLTDFSAANALTHFYAYIQEALVELGCGDVACAGMASAGRYQDSDGAVPAYSDVTWVCSTGQAQLAQVWYRLGENERADAAMRFLEVLQNPSGGFFGSYGRQADYFPDEEISWAVKYAIEAAQLQIASHFNQTVNIYQNEISESDPRVEGVLNYLGDLNGKRVLDAGCGKGRYAAVIKQRYPQADVTALDISEEMLRYVPDGINKVQGGILDMPFGDGQFDAVICIEALEHVVNIENGVKELSRVLAGGGKLMIIDKNKEKLGQLKMPSWEKWFGREELLDMMLSNGLRAQAQFIGHDKVTEPDGLFIAWIGQKEYTISTRDVCSDLKRNNILAGTNEK